MTQAHPHRLVTADDLGRARRSLDMGLGLGALLPLALLAAAAFAGALDGPSVQTLTAIWTGALLCFFAGVRRGLTFSETGGGRAAELATMLGLFALGVLVMLFRSVDLATVGLAAVGALDAVAGIRLEAPRYFRSFRPVQMAVGVLLLLAIRLMLG